MRYYVGVCGYPKIWIGAGSGSGIRSGTDPVFLTGTEPRIRIPKLDSQNRNRGSGSFYKNRSEKTVLFLQKPSPNSVPNPVPKNNCMQKVRIIVKTNSPVSNIYINTIYTSYLVVNVFLMHVLQLPSQMFARFFFGLSQRPQLKVEVLRPLPRPALADSFREQHLYICKQWKWQKVTKRVVQIVSK